MKTTLAKVIATVCGAGFSPIAPGTVGSLVALPSAYFLHWLGGFPLLLLATVVGFYGLWHAGVAPHIFPWPGIVVAFLFFRLFDIWKVGPVGWADRRGDPLGVMLDDVIAGIFAAAIVLVSAALSHGVLGL